MTEKMRLEHLVKIIRKDPPLTINMVNRVVRECYREADCVFTDDMLVLSHKIKKTIDSNREKLKESLVAKLASNIDIFMSSNLPKLKQRSKVIKRVFYSDGKNEPKEIESLDKISEYDKKDLIFKEEAKDKQGNKTVRLFLLHQRDGIFYPERIDKERLSEFVARNQNMPVPKEEKKESAETKMDDMGEEVFLEDTFLIVPFKEKEEAKKSGAKWDAENSLWYAPKGTKKKKFIRWDMEVQQSRIRSEYEAVSSVGSSGKHPEEEFKEILDHLNLEHGNTLEFVDYATFRSSRAKPLKEKGSRKSSTPGSYKISIDPMGFYYGWAKNNHTGQYITYNQRSSAELKEISAEVRHIDEQIIKINTIIGEREEKRLLKEAIERCNKEYGEFVPVKKTEEHEYLADKKIDPYPFVRRKRKTIMIPLYDLVTGEMVSYQKIGKLYDEKEGVWKMKKRLAFGGEKNGSALLVSRSLDTKPEDLDVLFVAEGFSTAASIEKALNYPVFMGIDAGNLPKVTKTLSIIYPKKRIVIVADNDYGKVLKGMEDPTLNEKQKENTGVVKAKEAQIESGADIIVPKLSEEDMRAGLSDANDIHCKYGIEALRAQLVSALREIGVDITWKIPDLTHMKKVSSKKKKP